MVTGKDIYNIVSDVCCTEQDGKCVLMDLTPEMSDRIDKAIEKEEENKCVICGHPFRDRVNWTRQDSMAITVFGKEICGYCRDTILER